MSWQDCRLGDVLTLKRGHDLPEKRRVDGPVPVVSSSGITGYHKEAKAQPPGVVTGRYGTLGEVYFIDQEYWPLNTALYVVDFKGTHPRFASYFLKNALRNYQSDKAAVPRVDRNVLHELRVRTPDFPKQEAIAEILSAYDDLIENNRRRMALLEEAARQLYREWFVRLRFPGHEHTRIIDGVPEGWARRPLSEVASKIGSGATPRGGASAYRLRGVALIRSQNIYDFRFEHKGLVHIDDNQANKLSGVTVKARDILLNITGASVGRCCMVPTRHLPARVNQHVMIIRIDPRRCGPNYVLHTINSHHQKESLLSIARAGGSTREALTKEVVSRALLLSPPPKLMDAFEGYVEKLSAQSQLLASQNAKLAQARDILLPRLMSGEIAV